MSGKKNISAASIIGKTVMREKWLSIGIVLTVTGAVAVSLLPPLVLGKIIDRIAGGNFSGFSMAAEYFLLIFLTRGAGVPERELPHCLWSEDDAFVQERALR